VLDRVDRFSGTPHAILLASYLLDYILRETGSESFFERLVLGAKFLDFSTECTMLANVTQPGQQAVTVEKHEPYSKTSDPKHESPTSEAGAG
jgi:hypothetical protein